MKPPGGGGGGGGGRLRQSAHNHIFLSIAQIVPFSTLISIYHAVIALYLRYALIAWGQASKSQLNKLLQQSFRNALFALFTLLNREICHSSLYQYKNIYFPINFLYYQLLAETMSDVSNNLVPTNIQELFLPQCMLCSIFKALFMNESTLILRYKQNCSWLEPD